jgi:HAD superfamily hydrolase (TIGR01549 family)
VTPGNYDAYLVDLDGTLYSARWVKLAMAFELALFGWRAIRTLRRFRHEHEVLRLDRARALPTSNAQSSPYALQVARTAEALDVMPALVEGLVQTWMFERPQKWIRRFARTELLTELREFRAQGGRVALVSDYPAQKKLRALAAEALFEVVVANGEPHGPHKLKPDPEGYLSAARLLGVSPARCLVIGDRDDADGAAARSADMDFRGV